MAAISRSTYSNSSTLSKLTSLKEATERELAKRLPEEAPSEIKLPSIASLSEKLPQDTAVVEFFLYRNHLRNRLEYGAFLVRKNKAVERIDLGDAEEIDSLIKEWRKWISATPKRHRGKKSSRLV